MAASIVIDAFTMQEGGELPGQFIYFATRPLSPGIIIPPENEFRFLGTSGTDDIIGTVDFGPGYEAKFGTIANKVGSKIFWKVNAINNLPGSGQVTPAIIFFSIIQA